MPYQRTMFFLGNILDQLEAAPDQTLLWELHDQATTNRVSWGVTRHGLLKKIAQVRAFLAGKKLNKGDRCAMLAPNSIEWVAVNLAIMAEDLIVVPLYSRQAPAELVSMMKDCTPSLIICGDAELRDAIRREWQECPALALFDEVFAAATDESASTGLSRAGAPAPHKDSDPVTIIYTSGTSGEAKGVVLTAGNVTHMLGQAPPVPERVHDLALPLAPESVRERARNARPASHGPGPYSVDVAGLQVKDRRRAAGRGRRQRSLFRELIGHHHRRGAEPELEVDQPAVGKSDPAPLLRAEHGGVPLCGAGCAGDNDVCRDHRQLP